MIKSWIHASLIALSACVLLAYQASSQDLAPPEVQGIWIQPSAQHPAQPVWGHADGIRVGLWPMPGPRGLLRIYAPYLGHRDDRMINYIAVEPVPSGTWQRGFSELEESQLDGDQGLLMWSSSTADDDDPRKPTEPSRGVIARDGDVETLTVTIHVEPFRNGAHILLQVHFRSDRPYEVSLSTSLAGESVGLTACILTATMGNFARLRTLHLADGTRSSHDLWPTFSGYGFAEHVCFPLSDLIRIPNGDALFLATPDEDDPSDAEYEKGTFIGWHYYGAVATQYWRDETPAPKLRGCVNARATYWASDSSIPGGISIENLELVEAFGEGNTLWFGVMPGRYDALPALTDSSGEP
jgi:hypothetical protein